jgi:hypothetical protein
MPRGHPGAVPAASPSPEARRPGRAARDPGPGDPPAAPAQPDLAANCRTDRTGTIRWPRAAHLAWHSGRRSPAYEHRRQLPRPRPAGGGRTRRPSLPPSTSPVPPPGYRPSLLLAIPQAIRPRTRAVRPSPPVRPARRAVALARSPARHVCLSFPSHRSSGPVGTLARRAKAPVRKTGWILTGFVWQMSNWAASHTKIDPTARPWRGQEGDLAISADPPPAANCRTA